MDFKAEDIELILAKENALDRIVAWLKGKGLWEECNRDLGITKPTAGQGKP